MSVSKNTIIFNILGLLIVKAISMAVSLSTIPAFLRYFHGDKTLIGTWITFFTFITIIISFDFGIGNRLKNDILKNVSLHLEYTDILRESFILQIFVSISISIILIIISIISHQYINNKNEVLQLFQKSPELLLFSIFFIAIIMPLKLSYYVLQAQQKNALSAFIALAPQIGIYLYMVGASNITTSKPGLFTITSALIIANIICYLLPFLFINDTRKIIFNPKKNTTHWGRIVKLQIIKLKSGLSFFFIQISIIFLYSYNELYYLPTGTAEDIVNYQYYFRPFSLFSVGFSIISLPFWSAIRLSQLRNDNKRTKILFSCIILLNIPVAATLTATAYFYQNILDVWLGPNVFQADYSMLLLFSISSLLICVMHALSSILSGYDQISFQAKSLGFGLITKLIIFAILIINDSKLDPVMTSTTIGTMFVVSAFSVKVIEIWKKKLNV